MPKKITLKLNKEQARVLNRYKGVDKRNAFINKSVREYKKLWSKDLDSKKSKETHQFNLMLTDRSVRILEGYKVNTVLKKLLDYLE